MAGLMEVSELESPEMENGGGLFGPDETDEEMMTTFGKVILH